MPRKSDHEVHKYKRMSIGRRGHEIYKCMRSNCTHYLPSVELAVGRLCACWSCGLPVEMTQHMIGLGTVRPICAACKKEKIQQREILASIPMIADENEYEGEEYEE
jgi:hypothetical protein